MAGTKVTLILTLMAASDHHTRGEVAAQVIQAEEAILERIEVATLEAVMTGVEAIRAIVEEVEIEEAEEASSGEETLEEAILTEAGLHMDKTHTLKGKHSSRSMKQ